MKKFLVKPETKVKLSKHDPNDKGDFKGSKEEGLAKLEKLNGKLESLQELLYAEHKHKVLIEKEFPRLEQTSDKARTLPQQSVRESAPDIGFTTRTARIDDRTHTD